jgi:hypothetical protein
MAHVAPSIPPDKRRHVFSEWPMQRLLLSADPRVSLLRKNKCSRSKVHNPLRRGTGSANGHFEITRLLAQFRHSYRSKFLRRSWLIAGI